MCIIFTLFIQPKAEFRELCRNFTVVHVGFSSESCGDVQQSQIPIG